MPKERSYNPAAAQRKADKKKEIAKSKKQNQAQRNEKLARRNPERLQRQIDELKQLEQQGTLRPKDKETLEQLEKNVRGIRRAREALGDDAPKFQSNDKRPPQDKGQERANHGQHLGKRRRDEEEMQSSDTDPEIRAIPMPRDTPPPFPRPPKEQHQEPEVDENGQRIPHGLPAKPAVVSKQVYSSAPQMRDLRKEAVRFMPSTVAAHKQRVRGEGKLLEPEEIDRLEKAGYYAAGKVTEEANQKPFERQIPAQAQSRNMQGIDLDHEARKLEEELNSVLPLEISTSDNKNVTMEEVEDEGD
jgi:hypothetical protein